MAQKRYTPELTVLGLAGHLLRGFVLGERHPQDDCGYELSETFRVTPRGAECFCNIERKLFKD